MATGMGKRILLVDDDCDFLESLQLILLRDGHDVFPVSDGNEAISKYQELKPDIVLLDVRMPGSDGYETFLRLIEQDRRARVLFTSSYALDAEKYKDVRSKSLAGIINKPIEPSTIRRMIRLHAK